MSKLICPQCGKPAISYIRKMCISYAFPTTCPACGKKVGVSFIDSIIAIILILIATIGSKLVGSLTLKITVWVSSIVVMSVVHMLWVPLERK